MRTGNSGFLNTANAPSGLLGLGQDYAAGVSSIVSGILGQQAAKKSAEATKDAAKKALQAAQVQAKALTQAALSQEKAGAWKVQLVAYVPLIGIGLAALGVGSYLVYRLRRK